MTSLTYQWLLLIQFLPTIKFSPFYRCASSRRNTFKSESQLRCNLLQMLPATCPINLLLLPFILLLLPILLLLKVLDPLTGKMTISNVFHFTFVVEDTPPAVIPKTYHEVESRLPSQTFTVRTPMASSYRTGESNRDLRGAVKKINKKKWDFVPQRRGGVIVSPIF